MDPEENEALLRLGLHRLPPKEFPHIRSLAPVLADYDGMAELDEGITILLAGLAARLSPGGDGHNPEPGLTGPAALPENPGSAKMRITALLTAL